MLGQPPKASYCMNSLKQCRWCFGNFRTTAKGMKHHENHCDHNPNPPKPEAPEVPAKPKWTCPGCGKVVAVSHKNRHVCPRPTHTAIQKGKLNVAIETMRKNDRKRAKREAAQCPRCKQTPCATPDACGRWIRANAQHAERLRREAAELGRKQTN